MLDDEAIQHEIDPLGWAREYLAKAKERMSKAQDFGDVFRDANYIEAAAILYEMQPDEFRRLRDWLKSHAVHVGDLDRKTRECASARRQAQKDREREAAGETAKSATNAKAGPAQWASRKPAAQPVRGALLLAEIEAAILKHALMDKLDALVVALWILFTHVFEGAETNPFLRIRSPRENCGKTTLLKIVFRLSRSGWLVTRSTQAAYYRKLQVAKYTMLLDEGDAFLAENEIWRNILDGASDPDTAKISISVKVGDAWVEDTIDIFAPLAIASIGKLKKMHTVESRSLAVNLKRATPDERKKLTVTRQRALKAEMAPIAERCARWGADQLDAFTKARPVMPEYMDGREADKFEPLFAIAQLCGPDPLKRITSFVVSQSGDGSDEYSAMILTDIKQVFEDVDVDRIFQKELCAKLAELEQRPWREYGRSRKPINPHQLAQLLGPYLIVAHSIRVPSQAGADTDTDKRGLGYYWTDFEDAFLRYAPKKRRFYP